MRRRLFRIFGIATVCSVALLACVLCGCAATAAISAPLAKANAEPPVVTPVPSQVLSGPSLADLVPAQSLPARGEELWIIEKPPAAGSTASPHQLLPGAGMLLSRRGTVLLPLPLKQTDVRADVTGCIATVDVRQQFANPLNEAAEASYAFPLPPEAAVSEFLMTIGRRHIRGIVRERAEAEQIYREAHSQGFLASLMVQPSPDVFVQQVANLEPQQQVEVEIRYFHTLVCHDGWLEFVFPMAASARFAGAAAGDQRDGRNVSVAVHFNPGVSIERVESPSHQLAVQLTGNLTADATLVPADRIANRDLIVRCKLAGDGMKSSLLTEPDGEGGVFSLLLVPPQGAKNLRRVPLDVVVPIEPGAGRAANAAAAALLQSLSPQDRFQIVRATPDLPEALPPRPIPATPQNVARFVDALSTLASVGATGADVLRAALLQPPGEGRDLGALRIVCLVTDGRDGLRDTLAVIPGSLGGSRIVAIGVGSSPDRGAIDAIARLGRGAAVYLTPGQSSSPIFSELIECMSHPCITDMSLDWGGANVTEIFPKPTPVMFCGHAVWLTGRYRGAPPSTLIIFGKVGDQATTWTVRAGNSRVPTGRSPIACVWARRKISELACEAAWNPNPSLDGQIRQIALEYGLLSRYTAFSIVDAMSK